MAAQDGCLMDVGRHPVRHFGIPGNGPVWTLYSRYCNSHGTSYALPRSHGCEPTGSASLARLHGAHDRFTLHPRSITACSKMILLVPQKDEAKSLES